MGILAVAAGGLAGVCCLSACATTGTGAGTVGSAPPASATPASPATGAATPGTAQEVAAADESGCLVTHVSDESADLTLLAMGRAVYQRLDCRLSIPLKTQLAYVRGVPEVASEAVQSGATLVFEAAGDGAGLRIYTDRGTCVVTVSDTPKTKSLACG